MLKKLLNLNLLGYALFWSWHGIYLLFLFAGYTPLVAVQLFQGISEGWLQWQFAIFALVLYVVPIVGIIWGATRFRRQPRRLLLLGYGVEAPILVFTLLRFFAIRQTTPLIWLVFGGLGLGFAALLWQVLVKPAALHPALRIVRQVGLAFFLPFCIYAAVLVAFYALPLLPLLFRAVWDTAQYLFTHLTEFWRLVPVLPNVLIGGLFFTYTMTLLAGLPVLLPIIAVRTWRWNWQSLLTPAARRTALGLSGGVLLLWAVATGLAARQPQTAAFAALKDTPANLAAAQTVAAQQTQIRAGLLNSYLARFRYVGVLGQGVDIQSIYAQAFSDGTNDTAFAGVQQAFDVWISPFLYHSPVAVPVSDVWNDSFSTDSDKAAALYQRFFDQPINQAERAAIVQAARTTWDTAQARDAWQAVDEREVHLETQALQITEHGDWASVTLAESYRNITPNREEVVYYFSLPESAALTGLWLGNTPDRSQSFAYVVAPRGAAQQVYQEQVQVQRDPALLEQIGPRQYRLRAYPIEPPIFDWDMNGYRTTTIEAQQLYLWLSYDVLLQGSAWPMPQLAEKRNLFWDNKSVRTVNGATFHSENWLPSSVPANSPGIPQPKRVDFPNGQSVLATPLQKDPDTQALATAKIAVILDRSGSMANQTAALQDALHQLQLAHEKGMHLDLYLSAAAVRGEPASRAPWQSEPQVDKLFFFGGQHPAELLAQFAELRGTDRYDALLVLTDAGGYELGESPVALPDLSAQPVWFVHLGGLPLGYDDATLAAMQASGGSATDSLPTALAQIALRLAQPDSASTLLDGYYWQVLPTEQLSQSDLKALPLSDGFVTFAARRLLLAAFASNAGQLAELKTLDALHAIAVRYHIVTPYSSMLVLVNEQQKERLEALSQGADRFEREVEQVGETLPEVSGVPEPHEWLLLALAAVGLIWYWRSWRVRHLPA